MLLSLLRLRYAQRTRRMTAPFPFSYSMYSPGCTRQKVRGLIPQKKPNLPEKRATYPDVRDPSNPPPPDTPERSPAHTLTELPLKGECLTRSGTDIRGQPPSWKRQPKPTKRKKEIWGVRDRWEAERILKKCHLECSPKGNRMYSIHKTRTGCFKKRSCQRTRKCSCILKASKKKVKEISQEKKSNRY